MRAEVGEPARALLRRAMALIPDGAIDEALAAAEKAVEQAPGFGDALGACERFDPDFDVAVERYRLLAAIERASETARL